MSIYKLYKLNKNPYILPIYRVEEGQKYKYLFWNDGTKVLTKVNMDNTLPWFTVLVEVC